MNAFHDGQDSRVGLLRGSSVSLRDIPGGPLCDRGRWGFERAEMFGKFFNVDVETLLPRWVGMRGRCNGGVKVGVLENCWLGLLWVRVRGRVLDVFHGR